MTQPSEQVDYKASLLDNFAEIHGTVLLGMHKEVQTIKKVLEQRFKAERLIDKIFCDVEFLTGLSPTDLNDTLDENMQLTASLLQQQMDNISAWPTENQAKKVDAPSNQKTTKKKPFRRMA